MIISISIPEQIIQRFDNLRKSEGYASRSDAIRGLLREYLNRRGDDTDTSMKKVFVISLIYEKGGTIEQRISEIRHEYEEIESNLHMHLDEKNCVEIIIMKSNPERISAMLKSLRSVHRVKDVKILATVCEE